MFSKTELEEFMRVIEYPRNKRERLLAETVSVLGDGAAERIANDLPAITPQYISAYAVGNFQALDRYPNPKDQMISDHEIVEALQHASNRKEQAILVAIWMRFEEIKNSHQDATGMDVVYDTQLSLMDFVKYGEPQYLETNAGSRPTSEYASPTSEYASPTNDFASQQPNTSNTNKSSGTDNCSKVTLHTIYGGNTIDGYLE